MNVTLRQSDSMKGALDLTCDDCDEILCDVEDGDTLGILVAIANEHMAQCRESK